MEIEIASSSLSTYEVEDIFGLHELDDELWEHIDQKPIPQYLKDQIDRINLMLPKYHSTNKAYARAIINQLLIAAVCDQHDEPLDQRAASETEGAVVLELQHDTDMQLRVTY